MNICEEVIPEKVYKAMPLSKLKEQRLIVYIILAFVLLLIFKKPLEYILNYNTDQALLSHFLARTISRTIITVLAFVFIVKYGLTRINGFRPNHISNVHATIIPIGICVSAIWSNQVTYLSVPSHMLIAFIVSSLLVGLTEELIFRGIILPLLIKKSKRIFIPVIITSLMFGLIHYINLFRQPDNLYGITSQVIFAFFIGIFLSGLFLRTGNIFITAIVHGLINIAFGAKEMIEEVTATVKMSQFTQDYDWLSFFMSLLLFALIAISGYLMIIWSDKEKILEKIQKG